MFIFFKFVLEKKLRRGDHYPFSPPSVPLQRCLKLKFSKVQMFKTSQLITCIPYQRLKYLTKRARMR